MLWLSRKSLFSYVMWDYVIVHYYLKNFSNVDDHDFEFFALIVEKDFEATFSYSILKLLYL